MVSISSSKCCHMKTKPDKGWAWVVLIASFTAQLIIDGTLSSYGLIREEMISDPEFVARNMSNTLITLPGTVNTCFFLFGTLVGSFIINNLGARLMGIFGTLLVFIGIFTSPFASNIYAWVILYGVVGGLGQGFNLLVNTAIIHLYFDRYRGIACGISLSGAGFGYALLPFILNHMIKIFQWRSALMYYSIGICLINVMCFLTFIPLTDHNEEGTSAMRGENLPEATEAFLNVAASEILKAQKKSSKNERFTDLASDSAFNIGSSNLGTGSNIFRTQPALGTFKDESFWGTFAEIRRVAPKNGIFESSYTNSGKSIIDVDLYYNNSLRSLKNIAARTKNEPLHLDDIEEILEDATSQTTSKKDLAKDGVLASLKFLFSQFKFWLLILISVTMQAGYFVPFYYLESYAKDVISRDRIITVFQIIGLSHALGRVFGGFLANVPWLNLTLLSMLTTLLDGVVNFVFLTFPISFATVSTYGALHGFLIGVPIAIKSLILVDCLGLENLNLSMGITNTGKAISCIIGPMIIERIVKDVGSTNVAFLFFGGSLLVSGIIHVGISIMECYQRFRQKKMKNEKKS